MALRNKFFWFVAPVVILSAGAFGYYSARAKRATEPAPFLQDAPVASAPVQVAVQTSSAVSVGTTPTTAPAPTAFENPATATSAASPAPNPEVLKNLSMPATGLDNYFSSLNETNSEIYVVKPGDNLTKISKEHGVTIGQILSASGLKDENKLQVGMQLKIMKDKWDVVVDKSTYTLYLKAAGKVVQTFKIGLGKDNSTPAGSYKIMNRLKNPTWYHDGVVAPFGDPKNPLGTRWMGFDLKGYGLHGTIEPDSIGKSESMGCVRMLNEDVEKLYELLPVGTPIAIVEKVPSR